MHIHNCTSCDLWITRKHIVCGVPVDSPKFMFIAESPNYTEDKKGIPFIGTNGKLLIQYIIDYGLNYNSYLTNAVKCRTPMNRVPTNVELSKCQVHLKNEINLYRPQIIIAVGATSLSLVRAGYNVCDLRGKLVKLTDKISLTAIYNPSYIIKRNDYTLYDNDFKFLNKLL